MPDESQRGPRRDNLRMKDGEVGPLRNIGLDHAAVVPSTVTVSVRCIGAWEFYIKFKPEVF
jgi:hypothetical protein